VTKAQNPANTTAAVRVVEWEGAGESIPSIMPSGMSPRLGVLSMT
jgi:hypothetical protein